MKSALNLKPLARALVLMGTIAGISDAIAGASQNPVCTPSREVSGVLGRGAPVAAQAHCQVERKVRPASSVDHVSTVQGRAGAAPRQSEPAVTVVNARVSGSRAVETVLGRAGGPVHQPAPFNTDTVASPTQ